MELVPQLSGKPFGTIPNIGFPLLCVVSLSMLKDFYEDFFVRKSADNEENSKIAHVARAKNYLIKNQFLKTKWEDIEVGQIIKIEKN
jgi:hypothetical protein